jgi:hypothetical protein
MKSREIVVGVAALFAGAVMVAVLIFFVREMRGFMRAKGGVDAGIPIDPTPLTPLEPSSPDDASDGDDAGAPDATLPPPVDAGHKRKKHEGHEAGGDASHVGVRAENLLIHPTTDEQVCLDQPSRRKALQVFTCHGKKNQRWVIEEDPDGVIKLETADQQCVQAAGADPQGGTSLVIGSCDGATRFRHGGSDHRFREVGTSQCLTARGTEKHAHVVLLPCDTPGTTQAWGLGR